MGTKKAYACESEKYVFITFGDPTVLSPKNLPKVGAVAPEPKHDLSLMVNMGVVPDPVARNIIKEFRDLQAAGGEEDQLTDADAEQIAQLDQIELNFDIDLQAGNIISEQSLSGKPGAAMEAMYQGSKPGPLRSSIGLSPSAVASLAMRGDYVSQSFFFAKILRGFQSRPLVNNETAAKACIDLLEELAKTKVDDFSMSVSGDLTTILAASLKSTESFELKVGEIVDRMRSELAKNAGDAAEKVKASTQRDAVTIGGVKLSRIWVPQGNKAAGPGYSIYLGAKDNVAVMAISMVDSIETIERSFNQKPIAEHDPFFFAIKLKDLAQSFGVSEYKGSAVLKGHSKGGNPFVSTYETPVKDIAELFKADILKKITRRLSGRVIDDK